MPAIPAAIARAAKSIFVVFIVIKGLPFFINQAFVSAGLRAFTKYRRGVGGHDKHLWRNVLRQFFIHRQKVYNYQGLYIQGFAKVGISPRNRKNNLQPAKAHKAVPSGEVGQQRDGRETRLDEDLRRPGPQRVIDFYDARSLRG